MSNALMGSAGFFVIGIAPGAEIAWFAYMVAKHGFKAAIPTGAGIIIGRIVVMLILMFLSMKTLKDLSEMQNVYAAYLVLAGLGMLLWARRVFDAERVAVEQPLAKQVGIGALLSATNPISLPMTTMFAVLGMDSFGEIVETLFSVIAGTALALGFHALWATGARKFLEPATALKTVWTVLGVIAIILGIRIYME